MKLLYQKKGASYETPFQLLYNNITNSEEQTLLKELDRFQL